jgi:gliding motility-associated-like protein
MCRRRSLLLFLFILFTLKAFPAVFVVTSNADSGPGTLREALTLAAANGIVQTDYINFNLPDLSVAGRTISLQSLLPYLSSNLVIDGSTQPGEKIGISDAKVIIEEEISPNYPQSFVCLRSSNADNIEIDGFYFNEIYAVTQGSIAILMDNTTNIVIGKAGKGNTFGAADWDVYLKSCNHIKISGNYFGFNPITLAAAFTASSGNLSIYNSDDISIGGDSRSDGNIFVSAQSEYESQIYGGNQSSGPTIETTKCVIKNNTLGYYANGRSLDFIILTHIKNVQIEDNLINYSSGFSTSDIYGELIAKGNQCNVDNVHPNGNSSAATPFQFYNVNKAIIGGPNPGDANTVINKAYTGDPFPAFYAAGCGDILLQRNIVKCKTTEDVYISEESKVTLPIVSITNASGNKIGGMATPGAEIEVFSDGECQFCEPTHYSGSVIAGGDGSWSYTAPDMPTGYTVSASLNGRTSMFSRVGLDLDGVKIIYPSCGFNNGSIKGIKVVNVTKAEWKDQSGNIVSKSIDADNLPPGTYTFTAYSGEYCNKQSPPFVLFDATPKINDQNLQITQPSCGNNTGSIVGLYLKNPEILGNDDQVVTAKWVDAGGNVKENGWALDNVSAGAYRLEVSYNNQCTTIYGPIILENSSGPNIDQSSAKIQSTSCGQSTGSIINLNIIGTGTLKYSWLNSQQQQVGTDKDLINQPAGVYKLKVTDDTQCGPVYTSDFEIPETNGITLDESKATKTAASCSKNNGSVTGITANGATQFVWTDANGHVAGNAVDLTGAASGDYTLTVSNAYGCSKTSAFYHVDQQAPTVYPNYIYTIASTCFGAKNGTISVNVDALPKTFRWFSSDGSNAGSQAAISGLAAGSYQLYLTDNNGCESYYNTYNVTELQPFVVSANGTAGTDDCGNSSGAVTATTATGGLPPYIFTWFNSDHQQISTGPVISNLAAGNYTLHITDSGCGSIDVPYTIQAETENITAPSAPDIQLCSSGNAMIMVNNAVTGATYRLYDSETSTQPLAAQSGGKFTVSVTANRSFFISQINGNCESQRTEVKVTVGLSVLNIANAFTPNGDGINDYWKISSIENYPDAVVQVFTRYGQKVFESKGYSKPFDGTINGSKLPVGVYYYIINLKTNCNILSGSLTIVR